MSKSKVKYFSNTYYYIIWVEHWSLVEPSQRKVKMFSVSMLSPYPWWCHFLLGFVQVDYTMMHIFELSLATYLSFSSSHFIQFIAYDLE